MTLVVDGETSFVTVGCERFGERVAELIDRDVVRGRVVAEVTFRSGVSACCEVVVARTDAEGIEAAGRLGDRISARAFGSSGLAEQLYVARKGAVDLVVLCEDSPRPRRYAVVVPH